MVAEIAEVHKDLDYPTSEKQLQGALPMSRNLPMTVISRGKQTDVAQVWSDLQADLASQTDYSQHIIAANSGHGIQFDEPEVVVSAIQQALDRARVQTLSAP